ncbi:amidohydrolase [Robertkochia marina]|uniref:Amidohydrolase n=1 Tax=Robertkochia marina TaxID=1227945 RepID=A0A4S3M4A9_9FLAO|nr:amidohydrolase [Robertkochia marina]THD69730.1 amidohydrolase [Robertkochia marina]TRZ46927.1 amidohydrolase [Robertkochia marina]
MKSVIYFLITSVFILVSCKDSSEKKQGLSSESNELQQTIFFGGDIITMEGDEPQYVEALVQQDGKIVYVGDKEGAMKQYGGKAKEIDLKGQTLVPGFVDGHAHFANFGGQAVCANLLAEPDGKVNTIDDLVAALKTWYEENGTEKTDGWIVGIGYDDAVLKEGRHPTKEDLDKVSTELPVMATHISGHFSAVNTKGLEMIGYDATTKDPAGGVIRRMEGSQEPNGVLEELASIPPMLKVLSPTEQKWVDYYLDKGQEMAFSYGYTTAQEGRAMTNHEQLADYAERGKMKLDVVSYVDYSYPQYLHSAWNSRDYKNHYRIGGIKLTLDGSPQGRTAWRTEPYLIPPDGQKEGYSGYPAIPDDEDVMAIVDTAFANNWQLLIHCNADASADQLFRAMNKAVKQYGNEDRRTTLIHGQLIRMDQLDSLKKYDMVGSFFPMHTFYWGDWYKQIIGPEKAQQISPIKSALNMGIPVTSHTDAPVALPNLMMIMHTTVNRVSRSGTVMGPDERLTPYEALKSITIWGAWQHFEEERKGTLSEGKLADLVILDKNPLKVDPMTLKDIKVVETIKEGKSVYRMPSQKMAFK